MTASSIKDNVARISASKFRDEADAVGELLENLPYDQQVSTRISANAARIVTAARADTATKPLLDTFLVEYGLSNKEGIALMCLAECLLRIPDRKTAELLIADKIQLGDWAAHSGQANSALVNASTWALMLCGKLVSVDDEFAEHPGNWLRKLTSRIGEPVIESAMRSAIQILSREFVLGSTIEEALDNSSESGLYSYDMLGEAARESATATRYAEAYLHAIDRISKQVRASDQDRSSISIKLSALHPRYEEIQRDRVIRELVPVVKQLCLTAGKHNIELTIDAEEADRLELSLAVFETIVRDLDPDGLQGFGMVIQAYGKRALPELDWLIALADETGRRIPVRLVKGAYWDAEIKHAQIRGLPGFPVYTRKPSTDLSYLVCARRILDHPEQLRGQFATHNAHTVAAIMEMAGTGSDIEFQRLHGMGEHLFRAAERCYEQFPNVRVYAPVGPHDDLLAYLVRRLLENGANSSFVNRFLDEEMSPLELVSDPVESVQSASPAVHPGICLPSQIFAGQRTNSMGVDLTDRRELDQLSTAIRTFAAQTVRASSLIPGKTADQHPVTLRNPADREAVIGECIFHDGIDIDHAFARAAEAQPGWNALQGSARAALLEDFADKLESGREYFVALLCHEAGKTLSDGIDEVREVVDFCRYYAFQARRLFDGAEALAGPTGESNQLSLHGRGVYTCISPWNFPLAIFIGQVAAALAAGNTVLAKPAEETPLVAFEAIRLLHQSGVPANVCQLILGDGRMGEKLVRHPLTAGVTFTGGTGTAQRINLAMAETQRAIAPLIAETGGQNAMVADSTALLEQVTDDVIKSAFLSAGQRCSALRVLYVQEEIADKAIAMIIGAMDELRVGNPAKTETDVGPVISEAAASSLQAHARELITKGKLIHSVKLTAECDKGFFIAPSLFEISSIDDLDREHFGPFLHVVRFPECRFDDVLHEIFDSGYGLTFGLHSRIESRIAQVFSIATVGNMYVNRNMTGAVVGSQPFGGQRLSGTGPKAGGPNYLLRFATEKVLTVNTAATGGNAALLSLSSGD